VTSIAKPILSISSQARSTSRALSLVMFRSIAVGSGATTASARRCSSLAANGTGSYFLTSSVLLRVLPVST
jgi:hypothetical protein